MVRLSANGVFDYFSIVMRHLRVSWLTQSRRCACPGLAIVLGSIAGPRSFWKEYSRLALSERAPHFAKLRLTPHRRSAPPPPFFFLLSLAARGSSRTGRACVQFHRARCLRITKASRGIASAQHWVESWRVKLAADSDIEGALCLLCRKRNRIAPVHCRQKKWRHYAFFFFLSPVSTPRAVHRSLSAALLRRCVWPR